MSAISFSGIALVSCGTLSMELNHLKQQGFLDSLLLEQANRLGGG